MTKREQIIIALMAVTIVVGGYLYFSGSGEKGRMVPTLSGADVESLNKAVASAIKQQGLSGSQSYALNMIAQGWDKDPFAVIETKEADPVKEVTAIEAVRFEYTAYVRVGDRFVGVINGREYQAGDALAQKGYSLIRIDSKSALVKGPGDSNMIVVPYKKYLTIP